MSYPAVVSPSGRETSPILTMIRVRHPNYHPLLALADLAHSTQDEKIQLDCHKTIAKYVEPELKSLELKAPPDEHRRVRVSLFEVIEADFTPVPAMVGP